MRDIAGRVAVVTGAASGIGAAVATRFAAEGMKVVLSDIDGGALGRTVDRLHTSGADVCGVVADVSLHSEIEHLAAAALDEYGHVHLLCNTAGVVLSGRLDELTDAEWRLVIDVDLWGAIHGVRVFLPLLEREGVGHIVSASSTAGLSAPAFVAPYAVAEAGVIALMESLRRELELRCSSIGASVLCTRPNTGGGAAVAAPRSALLLDGAVGDGAAPSPGGCRGRREPPHHPMPSPSRSSRRYGPTASGSSRRRLPAGRSGTASSGCSPTARCRTSHRRPWLPFR